MHQPGKYVAVQKQLIDNAITDHGSFRKPFCYYSIRCIPLRNGISISIPRRFVAPRTERGVYFRSSIPLAKSIKRSLPACARDVSRIYFGLFGQLEDSGESTRLLAERKAARSRRKKSRNARHSRVIATSDERTKCLVALMQVTVIDPPRNS